MTFSAHKDPDQLLERDSSDDVMERQAEQVADMIKAAKHFVAFTGAGISTSAGIPDFRGPDGVWTRRAQGREAPRGVSTTRAVPTATHMALVAMATAGRLKLLISQNCDGLHRRSGFPPERLAELHGNSNLEYCRKCGRQYLRDFHVRTSASVHEHRTGRACRACGGALMDSVINFGESLPDKPLSMGFEHCRAADLVLCLGSSLTVTPAANMPEEAAQNGAKLVICNLQKTPLDPLCCLRVFGRTDDLMQRVCHRLGVEIPAWRLRRRLRVDVSESDAANAAAAKNQKGTDDKQPLVTIACVEEDGTPATVFQRLDVQLSEGGGGDGTKAEFDRKACAEATVFHVRAPAQLPCSLTLRMAFMGHYGEPGLSLKLPVDRPCKYAQQPVVIEFDPATGRWECIGV